MTLFHTAVETAISKVHSVVLAVALQSLLVGALGRAIHRFLTGHTVSVAVKHHDYLLTKILLVQLHVDKLHKELA